MNKLKISINKINFWVNHDGYESYWELVNRGKWEPETFSVFDKYINKQTLFIDIGGWIGPTSIYGAQIAQKTFSLEPDPIAFQRLQENLNLNSISEKKIKIFNLALWSKETTIRFVSETRLGDSSSSVIRDNKNKAKFENNSFEARTITLNKLIEISNLGDFKQIFVKIDIEGAEYQLFDHLIEKLYEINATFLVSSHPWLLHKKSKKGFIRRLKQALEHWKFCQKIKRNKFKLFTSNKNFPYIPIVNSIGWILIGRMHQDILAIPYKP